MHDNDNLPEIASLIQGLYIGELGQFFSHVQSLATKGGMSRGDFEMMTGLQPLIEKDEQIAEWKKFLEPLGGDELIDDTAYLRALGNLGNAHAKLIAARELFRQEVGGLPKAQQTTPEVLNVKKAIESAVNRGRESLVMQLQVRTEHTPRYVAATTVQNFERDVAKLLSQNSAGKSR